MARVVVVPPPLVRIERVRVSEVIAVPEICRVPQPAVPFQDPLESHVEFGWVLVVWKVVPPLTERFAAPLATDMVAPPGLEVSVPATPSAVVPDEPPIPMMCSRGSVTGLLKVIVIVPLPLQVVRVLELAEPAHPLALVTKPITVVPVGMLGENIAAVAFFCGKLAMPLLLGGGEPAVASLVQVWPDGAYVAITEAAFVWVMVCV